MGLIPPDIIAAVAPIKRQYSDCVDRPGLVRDGRLVGGRGVLIWFDVRRKH